MATNPAMSGVIKTALEIAQHRVETLGLLRQALLAGDDKRAIELARELCGLRDEEKGDRTRTRLN